MAEKEEYSFKNKIFTPKYIIAYIIVGVIVYGLVYYFFFAGKQSYSPNNYQPPANTSPAPLYP